MPTPIQNPTFYAIPRAIAYADTDGSMLQVSKCRALAGRRDFRWRCDRQHTAHRHRRNDFRCRT